MVKSLFVCAVIMLSFLQTNAQQAKKIVADKIVATLSDQIVLKSDIDNELFDRKRSGEVIPPNADCSLLENALAMKALYVQAERDSVTVPDEEVEAQLDNRIRQWQNQFGTREILEQVMGKTIFQFKEEMRPRQRESMVVQAERDHLVGGLRITPEEVTAYYDAIPKDSLKFYESELTIGEIVLFPKPSRDVDDYVINQLKEYKDEVESGKESFEKLARLYSDDKGTKENGGLFELNRNDKNVDPTFLSKSFGLKDGQVSTVFKSQFGYHIIQMVSRRGDDATVRHILKIPQVSSVEVNESIQKLDSIRNLLVSGDMSFGTAVDRFSEDKYNKFTGGLLSAPDGSGSTTLTIDQLQDQELVFMLDSLKVGHYSKPVAFTDPTGKKGVRIVYLVSKSDPHRENLRDDYDKIAQRALAEKQNELLDEWFQNHLRSFYVDIDPQYAKCPNLTKWLPVTAVSK